MTSHGSSSITARPDAARPLPRYVFPVVVTAYVLVLAGAGAPVPLYELYRTEDGLSTGDLAFAAVAYFGATMVALLVLGRASDYIGRKPVLFAAIALGAGGLLLMATAHSIGVLALARFLQGIASGLTVSGVGAYVVDTAPERPRWLATTITGSGPMFGIPFGALFTGVLIETAPAPRVLAFSIIAAALVVCGVILAFAPETERGRPGILRSLVPRLSAPPGSGRLLFAVGAAYVATWSIGGSYQAFAPTITADYLGSTSALVAAAVFSSIMIAGPLGGPIAGRLGPRRAARIGIVVFAVAVVGAVGSLWLGAIVPFLVASLIAAIAQGTAATAGTRALLDLTDADHRGATLSSIYVLSYAGAAIPTFVAGRLTDALELPQIYVGYAVFTIMAAVIVLVAFPRVQHR